MQSIALFCGIAGMISSVVAVVVVILLRKHIVDIIDKDVILFDGNFNTKKDVITTACELLDHVATRGKQLTLNPDFANKAKHCYNNLLCVMNSLEVINEFFNIAINPNTNLYRNQIENFKLMCRKDLGLKIYKITKSPNQSTENTNNQEDSNDDNAQLTQPAQPTSTIKPKTK